MIELDVTEHGLGFNRSHTAMVKSLLAGQEFLGFRPLLIVIMIDLNNSLIGLALVTHPSQRASYTVLGAILTDCRHIAEV